MTADPTLRLIEPIDAIRTVFAGCEAHTLVPVGAIRTTTSDPSPHPLPIFPVPVGSIDVMLPEVFAAMRDEVQLVILHPLIPAASKTTPKKFRGHPIPYEKSKVHVDALCCIAIPLRLMGEDGAEVILQLCAIRSVPEPTTLLVAGEKITALWLLRAESGDARRPPRNLKHERNERLALTDEIVKRLPELQPNRKESKDVVSWHVMPGSVDAETGEVVQAVQIGKTVRYFTLSELREELLTTADESSDLHRNPNEVYGDLQSKWAAKTSTGKKKITKQKPGEGPKSDERRVQEIMRLVEHRAGKLTPEEQRQAIFHFAGAVYRDTWIKSDRNASRPDRHQLSFAATHEAVSELVKLFDDPISEAAVRKASRSGYWHTAKNETVAADLHVTNGEAEAIGLKSLASEELKKKRAWRERLESGPREAVKNEIEKWAVRLLGRGYSYGVVEKATGIPKSSVRNLRKRVYGERYIKPQPLKPKDYWSRVVEDEVNGEKVLRVESSDDLMGDEEVDDEFYPDDDPLSHL
ncbi:MAG TPA: hypothetical protein VHW00_13095 [Thermoanaerobaculia bacterium]|nr:hypothetical protein [Thermoanaerobaculia bacterium]